MRLASLSKVVAPGLAFLAVLGAAACGATEQHTNAARPAFLVEKTGGPTSASVLRGRPFNQPARSLSGEEFTRFGQGALEFDAHVDVTEGLGPRFNEDSCLSCHLDGVTPAPEVSDGLASGALVRLSREGTTETGAPIPEPTYGVQLQTRSVGDTPADGSVAVHWTTTTGHYPDGTRYRLRQPRLQLLDLSAGPLDEHALVSLRIATPLVGLGLLEAIPAGALNAAADPEDRNHDGISGRVNRVWDSATESVVAGRFGWKAGQPSVDQQTAVALVHDMGVTSPSQPEECGSEGSVCSARPHGLTERSPEAFADLVFYTRTIAVPVARNVDRSTVQEGAAAFVSIGCADCHTTTQTSGSSDVAALSNVTFHPLTDLLLHDMGPGLADGRSEFLATGTEWRTPPLWGLGRRAATTGSAALLHDGRARSSEEAILWHDGEARSAKLAFRALSASQRTALIDYLDSL
jgi:CxxC motif-containing protein (DUF1111 family)